MILDTEAKNLERFVAGLRQDIKKDVKPHESMTYIEALRKAFVSKEAIEDIKRETQLVWKVNQIISSIKHHKRSKKKKQKGSRPVCNFSGDYHGSSQCRKRPGVCFSCGKEGHRIKDALRLEKEITPDGGVYVLVVGKRDTGLETVHEIKGETSSIHWHNYRDRTSRNASKGAHRTSGPISRTRYIKLGEIDKIHPKVSTSIMARTIRDKIKEDNNIMRVFAMTHHDAEAANEVVESMILISNNEASTLFDSCSTQSFVSHAFAAKLENPPSTLTNDSVVSTPTGEHICTITIFRNCMLEIGRTRIPADLVLLHMDGIDIIIGMDWLSKYMAVLGSFNKVV